MNSNRFTLNREPAQSVPILTPVASAYPGIGVLGIEVARGPWAEHVCERVVW